jgi:hypothetical protein
MTPVSRPAASKPALEGEALELALASRIGQRNTTRKQIADHKNSIARWEGEVVQHQSTIDAMRAAIKAGQPYQAG